MDALFTPSSTDIEKSKMFQFMKHVESKFDKSFFGYSDLHFWSVSYPDLFWPELFNFFKIDYIGSLDPVYDDLGFEHYSWFKNVKLNFAENLLKIGDDTNIAIKYVHESGKRLQLTYQELREQVSKLAQYLESLNLLSTDVLAAYMPNIPETVIAMLAGSSHGATFTSTSCDFGIDGVVERFSQSKPRILITVVGYEYNGKYIDQTEKILEIRKQIPSLEKIILVDFLDKKSFKLDGPDFIDLKHILKNYVAQNINYKKVSFDHPQYIMYSSGTTGKPKCIVHSVGGTLLQHVKEIGLHVDHSNETNIFFFTTCGWMMWNWLVSSLYFGGTTTLYEGAPSYPTFNKFLSIIDTEQISIFGTSPKFLKAYESTADYLNSEFTSLKLILSTGAPLLAEQFDFVYKHFKKDVMLSSISGGTDIISCFMLGNPILPVFRGEIQCLSLGMDVDSFDSQMSSVRNSEGELVCKKSFPSRPIYFLNDENHLKIKSAYFDTMPGVWYHGDYILINNRGGVEVFGRSDATLNPGGVRIGTAEIYRQTEKLSYLLDSICVGKQVEGDVDVYLFVKLVDNIKLDNEKIKEIKAVIRNNTTPRHVPSRVIQVSDIPYTRSGKKVELAVTKLINGKPVDNLEAIMNPESLTEFKELSKI